MNGRKIIALIILLISSLAVGAENHGVILQYHHISDETPASTSLSPASFRAQLDILEQGGYNIVSLPYLLTALRQNIPLKDKTVAITFDDGYVSVYETAFPMLRERGWPFTVFIAPDAIDNNQPYTMSWQQIKQLSEAGVTIANHSFSHQHLVRKLVGESDTDWQNRIIADIQKAERIIQDKTSQNHRLFAWPYGEFMPELLEPLASAGFIALAQHSGPVHSESNFQALPRFPFSHAFANLDNFILKSSSLPLPVKEVKPEHILFDHRQSPVFKFTLVESYPNTGQISCYASEQGRVKSRVDGQVVTVELHRIPPVGRSRINCTLAAGNKRFHWFSLPIIRKHDDGSWYQEP